MWHLVLWILWQTLFSLKSIYPRLNKRTTQKAQKQRVESICTSHPQSHSTGWSCLSHALSCRLWSSLLVHVLLACSSDMINLLRHCHPLHFQDTVLTPPCFYWGSETPKYSICCCRVGQNSSSLSPSVTGEPVRLRSGALEQDFRQGHLLLSHKVRVIAAFCQWHVEARHHVMATVGLDSTACVPWDCPTQTDGGCRHRERPQAGELTESS